MAAKMGRPTDNPKNDMIHVRMDKDTVEKLNEVSKIKGISRAKVIRTGIKIQYDQLKK